MLANGNRRPIVVDLFAGAGGLSLGFEQAGFDIAVAVEFDPVHSATHEYNFPCSAVICADVRQLSGDGIRSAAGLGDVEIDVLVGGPPCQGFSLIGHRVLDDPRNDLVFHFLRLVDELQPRAFVMENVAGMATGQHTRLLEELIERFKTIGYSLRLPYQILNAADYGIPQNRRRLFLLGARSDIILPNYPVKQTVRAGTKSNQKGMLELPLGLPFGPTVADAICDIPDIELFESLFESDEMRIRPVGGSEYAMRLRGDLQDERDYSYPRYHDPHVLSGCLRARHTDLSRERFAATVQGSTEPVSRFFKLPLDGTSNTLRAGTASDRGAFSAPRPIHPVHPRCISVREAARLHSFPDWFRFHKTIWHGFRQIGNSVPPLLGRAVAEEVRAVLGFVPLRPSEPMPSSDPTLVTMDMSAAALHFGVSRSVIPPRRRLTDTHSA
ncbi:MAG TPA: DNA cytosine methyltransferase [Thermomicrobiales bacterium]|nr:DNA (cytosine-5-)-methyltransferase [Chloroflexota bacterium]HCG29609.1 DNA (cytosine-5-)-methyltransferase [Chloroflexota bacterium]HQX62272.1 DNA cytosine methyltransferase [Thermomicrobiales bacterium]HQZ89762.1 DNA cytosine methyltransferase [Thermomicrobiales bacterium]HRA30512.1 DNA cytosine methyltransferase [Thermomicrobiales bacterium]